MIFGKIENLAFHLRHLENVNKLLDSLLDWRSMDHDFWYDFAPKIRGIRLLDWNRNENVFESHKYHVDLHLTLDGTDIIRFCESNDIEVISPYDSDKDCSLFRVSEFREIALRTGEWALIFPDEVHRNYFADEVTEKLVVKLHLSLWER